MHPARVVARCLFLGPVAPICRLGSRQKLKGRDKVFQERRSGVDAGRPALKACLEYLREGDTLLVTKLDRLARSTPDLYRIVSELNTKGVSFKVLRPFD
jgi:DNA invertase Pin-like site-specific DNA recombinase